MKSRLIPLALLLMIFVAVCTACTSGVESPIQSSMQSSSVSIQAQDVPSEAEGTEIVNTAGPSQTQMTIREMQPKPSDGTYRIEFVKDYISANRVSGRTKAIPPVYREEQILCSLECYAIGQDAGMMARYSGARSGFFEDMVTMFPDSVLRDIGDYVYLCYDTETGMRLYLFYSKEKDECMFTDGYPVIMKEKLNYEDFEALKPGDHVQDVESIDPITTFYIGRFNEYYPDDMLQNVKDHTGWFQTIHLLTDGILRINYDKVDGKYVITGIIYREDFILDGLNGQTCYQIYEEDYKG